MSESQKIAALREKLAQIENQIVSENPLAALKGAMSAGKNLAKNFKGGLSGDKARSAAGTFAPQKSAAGVANTAGKTVAANPVKTAAATGAAGIAAGAATTAAVSSGQPAASGVAAKPAAPMIPQEKQELDALAKELEAFMGQDPALDALLLKHTQATKSAPSGAAAKPAAPAAAPAAKPAAPSAGSSPPEEVNY
jgi:hypothetical protein